MKTYSLKSTGKSPASICKGSINIPFFATVRRSMGALLLAGIGVAGSSTAEALTFTNNFDGTWGAVTATGATSQSAVLSAETILSNIFTGSNVNVKLSFGSDSTTGGAYSYFNNNDYPASLGGTNPGLTYAQVKLDMQNASTANPTNLALAGTVANLPATITSTAPFFIPEADARALGAPAAQYPVNTYDGFVKVGTQTTWDAKESDGITAGQGDLTGVLLHEISHAMGRVDFAFSSSPDVALTPLDLSRYTTGGGLNFTNSNAVFSINGGTTALGGYSNTSDTGDWGSIVPANDANNAFFGYGQLLQWSTVDTQLMQAIGWEIASSSSVPDGGTTLAMLGLALGGMAVVRRKLGIA